MRQLRKARSEGHLKNELLALLDGPTFGAIESHLSVIHLAMGHVIVETHTHVQKVYFPHEGIISCVVELAGRGAIEIGMIGKDGHSEPVSHSTIKSRSTTW